MGTRHIFSVLVENKPGVLARVSGLFARRAFNIHSLAVGPTEDQALSRITLVVDAADIPLEQIKHQLNKLVNIIHLEQLDPDTSVQRRLLLVKVAANDQNRTNVMQVVEMFRAHIVDVDPAVLTIEATGSEQKIQAFLKALEPYGVKEIVQSGSVAIGRGAHSISEQVLKVLREN
ncbi:acetolactate synthase small subunit [Arcanobacterium hippocoleae]|uniref:Acetolactate synthase small subunit n=1 Tax=Arcanobacterium hippocoleae TaxID=149017 RepID=A0ABU1T1H0_9ACTO|nr:acetolactate synthase small subunit [Arcanobacterium hippocoleae]MDR6939192.1 acetolactate synthase-1/3 small subunit [Arcanobacterium hippocoleae]